MQPLLTDAEFTLFKKYVDKSETIVEFGSGGSTLYMLEQGKKVYAVENHASFYNELQGQIANKQKFFYLFVNTGETSEWGVPVDETPTHQWWPYYVTIWEKISEPIDFIFIDGRFRVMCALHALKHIEANKWNCVVCIHDFTIREHYHVLLEFFDVVESVDTLVILTVKKEINQMRVRAVMWQHCYDFR
jgi:hypothetical protein